MKKLCIICCLIVTVLSINAQTEWYQASQFAIKHNTLEWSDWQPSDVQICINYKQDIITIYSPEIQKYQIVEAMPDPIDATGQQLKYIASNLTRNKEYVYIRFRKENNGNSQIYVDFYNGSIVYNIHQINR